MTSRSASPRENVHRRHRFFILLYLLAAFMWAFVYTFLELVDPGSFNIEPTRPHELLQIFGYFSLVTITFRPAPLVQHLKGLSNSGMLMVRALLMVSPECTAQGPSCWLPTSSSRAGLVKDLINKGQPR